MARTLQIKKNSFTNPYKSVKRKSLSGTSSMDSVVKFFVATVAKIAKNSMRKAPKRPKSRFGDLRARRSSTKMAKRGKAFYWRKGQYSRPGHPPFWHDRPGNKSGNRSKASLKQIIYEKEPASGKIRYRVGPIFLPQKAKPPVPALHEHGGTKKVRTKSYIDRQGKKIIRPKAFTARYPPRPYMQPAMIKARYAKGRGKSFADRLGSIGGMVANKVDI